MAEYSIEFFCNHITGTSKGGLPFDISDLEDIPNVKIIEVEDRAISGDFYFYTSCVFEVREGGKKATFRLFVERGFVPEIDDRISPSDRGWELLMVIPVERTVTEYVAVIQGAETPGDCE